jgi:hypothetical protein
LRNGIYNAAPTIIDINAIRNGKAKDVVLFSFGEGVGPGIVVTYPTFVFEGGTPGDFVQALTKHFGMDWKNVEIPSRMHDVHIPAFRVTDPDSGGNTATLGQVLKVYNHISDLHGYDEALDLGRWDVEGEVYRPDIVQLTPIHVSTPAPDQPLKVKALSLEVISTINWEMSPTESKLDDNQLQSLLDSIRDTENHTHQYAAAQNLTDVGATLHGTVSVQRDAKILVVIGTPSYIDMVESILAAYTENKRVAEQRLHPAAPAEVKKPDSSPPAK